MSIISTVRSLFNTGIDIENYEDYVVMINPELLKVLKNMETKEKQVARCDI